MDGIGEPPDAERMRGAVLISANRFQFAPGEDRWVRMMGSRMLLWGVAGHGRIVCGDLAVDLDPGVAVLLPWRADVRYRADRLDPFRTGAAHLLPWHDPALPVDPRTAHGAHDDLHAAPHRRNVEWPGFRVARRLPEADAPGVIRLGESAIEAFGDGPPDEAALRAFGTLITQALGRIGARPSPPDPVPPALLAMQEYARSNLAEPLPVDLLAHVGGVSVSTAERQFRRYAGLAPIAWIRRERLSRAARLLRTTSLRIGEVAVEVGYPDPLHFSRAFRREHGVPPSRFARRAPLV